MNAAAQDMLFGDRLRAGCLLIAAQTVAARSQLVGVRTVRVAEDRRFEVLRGCPQHAFQVCRYASAVAAIVCDQRCCGLAVAPGRARTGANETRIETGLRPCRG